MTIPHAIRPAENADLAFVVNAWVEEMRLAPMAWGMPRQQYFEWQRAYIRRCLAESQTLIACAPDDASHLYGYITFAPPNFVHWCYVKSAFRDLGLASTLVREALGDVPRVFVTQASNAVLKYMRERRNSSRVAYIAPQYLVHQEKVA